MVSLYGFEERVKDKGSPYLGAVYQIITDYKGSQEMEKIRLFAKAVARKRIVRTKIGFVEGRPRICKLCSHSLLAMLAKYTAASISCGIILVPNKG